MNPCTCTACTARFLNKSEIAHLRLEAPVAFIELREQRGKICPGVYNVQRRGHFVLFKEARSLEALIEFLATGNTNGAYGETFKVTGTYHITCDRADGSEINYDLHRDNRFGF